MSSEAQPINPARFAAALPDLPLSSLFNKRAEIENSIAHLQISNEKLKQYAEEGDTDCKEAMEENVVVIDRMKQRIDLLRIEVENRGLNWNEGQKTGGAEQDTTTANGDANAANGTSHSETTVGSPTQDTATAPAAPAAASRSGGRLTDEELARRLAEQMDDDGVYL